MYLGQQIHSLHNLGLWRFDFREARELEGSRIQAGVRQELTRPSSHRHSLHKDAMDTHVQLVTLCGQRMRTQCSPDAHTETARVVATCRPSGISDAK